MGWAAFWESFFKAHLVTLLPQNKLLEFYDDRLCRHIYTE
jgi:hypothetical protein